MPISSCPSGRQVRAGVGGRFAGIGMYVGVSVWCNSLFPVSRDKRSLREASTDDEDGRVTEVVR